MTRVNLVHPKELNVKHLVAEYKELPRIFGNVRAAIERGEVASDPRNPVKFTLGQGHMRFFYPRIQFLVTRQYALIREMLRRGYAPTYRDVVVTDIPWQWHGDYVPTLEALRLSRARLRERAPNDYPIW